jgi:hypothetical protein
MVIEPQLIHQTLTAGAEVAARTPKPTYDKIIERLVSIDNEFSAEGFSPTEIHSLVQAIILTNIMETGIKETDHG